MAALSPSANGIQHLGLPTNDMDATARFYATLGFTVDFEHRDEIRHVIFFRYHDLVIEAYTNTTKPAVGHPGAIDHICLNSLDVENDFAFCKEQGFEFVSEEINFLPFYENGVRFFTIYGPNREKIEYCQKL